MSSFPSFESFKYIVLISYKSDSQIFNLVNILANQPKFQQTVTIIPIRKRITKHVWWHAVYIDNSYEFSFRTNLILIKLFKHIYYKYCLRNKILAFLESEVLNIL